MYRPTNFIQNYINQHGSIDISDDEFNKLFELIYAFHTVQEVDLPNVKTSEEVQEFRRKICSGCAQFQNGTCKICGCTIEEKIQYPTEHCPVNKWEVDVNVLKQRLQVVIDYLNEQIKTGFFTQPTLEQNEEKYRKLIEEGTKHE